MVSGLHYDDMFKVYKNTSRCLRLCFFVAQLVPTPPALPDYCTAQPTPTCVTTLPSPSQGESILVPMYDSTYHCSK